MDIDSPSSLEETSPSDTSSSYYEKSLDESFEEKENADTNNNESVEPDEQSKDKDKEKEAGKVNDDLECEEVTKDLHWKDIKLFPPEKNRSTVWKFGGFGKDDKGNLVKDKVVCSICGKKITQSGSPTNFKTHLIDKHGSIVQPVFDQVAGAGASKNQPKITLFSKSFTIKKYNNNHPKQKKCRKSLLNWTIRNKRPLGICEDSGFREVIEIADNQLCVPSRRTVSRDIQQFYLVKKKETIEKFSEVNYFSCTNDAGTSLAGHTFVDVNVHWLSEDFECEKKVVTVSQVKDSS